MKKGTKIAILIFLMVLVLIIGVILYFLFRDEEEK